MADAINLNAGGSPPVGALASGALTDTASLTPEALMIYCRTQLDAVDGQIKELFKQQKAAMAKKEVLGDLQSKLNEHAPPNCYDDYKAIEQGFEEAKAKLPEDSKEWKAIDDLQTACHNDYHFKGDVNDATGEVSVTSTMNGWHKADSQPFQDKISVVSDLLAQVGSKAELQMIQLQSLMGQRQTAVQLTTQIMAKMDQTMQAIVKNV